jgi:nucleoside-diphosphate-sugar epimerase
MSQHASPGYLVTGAMGCIGAWVLYHLVKEGKRAVSYDLSDSRHRLNLLLAPEEQQDAICFIKGDLTDQAQLQSTLQEQGIAHVIHLAALQVPFCRANPILGAQVNVVGTVTLFEAMRQARLKHLMYASSVAVYGPPAPGEAGLNEALLRPATLYGVYKVANEGTARVYWQDHGISSTALRPYTVYGLGRDQGVTSDPTKAMLAAVAGQPYHINFNGPCQYHFASDIALQCIAAAERPLGGAFTFNNGGRPYTSAEVVELIHQAAPNAEITHSPAPLPFPAGFDGAALRAAFPDLPETPLADGVRQTMAAFERLLAAGRITPPQRAAN